MRLQKQEIIRKIKEFEYSHFFDKKEFGKLLSITSFALLIVSVHAIYTIDGAVEQASNSTDRMERTALLVGSDSFQQSMESLSSTGVTIDGQGIDEITTNLEYASESVSGIEQLQSELENARTTYQWTALIGILGLVAGITSIYI